MAYRTSAAIVDGRIMLSAGAQRRGANIVHVRQSWWHRLLRLREVRREGFCCDCIGIARDAFDVMTDQER